MLNGFGSQRVSREAFSSGRFASQEAPLVKHPPWHERPGDASLALVALKLPGRVTPLRALTTLAVRPIQHDKRREGSVMLNGFGSQRVSREAFSSGRFASQEAPLVKHPPWHERPGDASLALVALKLPGRVTPLRALTTLAVRPIQHDKRREGSVMLNGFGSHRVSREAFSSGRFASQEAPLVKHPPSHGHPGDASLALAALKLRGRVTPLRALTSLAVRPIQHDKRRRVARETP